jgi:hypothetical protein
VVTNLHGSALTPMDLNGLSDPYVKFRCPELALATSVEESRRLADSTLEAKKPPQTSTEKKTLNPRWENSKLPQMFGSFAGAAELGRAHLLLHVVDWDRSSADDLIGTAVVDLARCGPIRATNDPPGGAKSAMVDFEVPVLREGNLHGTIAGRIGLVAVAPSRASSPGGSPTATAHVENPLAAAPRAAATPAPEGAEGAEGFEPAAEGAAGESPEALLRAKRAEPEASPVVPEEAAKPSCFQKIVDMVPAPPRTLHCARSSTHAPTHRLQHAGSSTYAPAHCGLSAGRARALTAACDHCRS